MSVRAQHTFRLFIAGDTPNSAQAIANLNDLCRKYLPGQHSIEVVDVFVTPQRALAEGIVMTPMLLRLEPTPTVRIIGSLRNLEAVLEALGIAETTT